MNIHRARTRWSAYWRASGVDTLFFNSGSLVGSTVIAGALGIAYWWLAARLFTPHDVGSAGAAIAATTLMAIFSPLGTGTLIIGELARKAPLERCRLITTALAVSTLTGALLGTGFGLVAPHVSSELTPFGGVAAVALLALGVSVMAAGFVIDHASIGLLRGDIQLRRNVVVAIGKLAVLVGVTWLPGLDGALAIYLSLVCGVLMSLASIGHLAGFRRFPASAYLPQWTLVRRLGRTALEHHVLNLSLQGPGLLMPVVVTILLSATANAYFYVAATFAALVYVAPGALSAVLYAAGSHDPHMFAQKMRVTMSLSIAIGVLANIAVVVAAAPFLSLLGRNYAEEVISLLQLMVAAVFPLIIKTHFVAVCQTRRQIRRGAILTISGAVIELLLATAGGRVAGLNGFTIGLVAAQCIEALVMAPVVIGALAPGHRVEMVIPSSTRS